MAVAPRRRRHRTRLTGRLAPFPIFGTYRRTYVERKWRLPDFERAILDIRKIEHYCLDPTHPRGRHKARVFRDALGIGRRDARWLRDALLGTLGESDAVEIARDEFGVRWRVDATVTRHGRSAMIRTVWIIRSGENEPRFVTCWVE